MTGIFTYKNFALPDTPRLDGKVALVTGGQAGIGKGKNFATGDEHVSPSSQRVLPCAPEISTQLLLHGIAKVYILARSRAKYEATLQGWREQSEIELGENEGRTEFVECDLGDMFGVKRAADQIRKSAERLDILICNAALPIVPTYSRSPQSIEVIFATNCVGHHILVLLLLPLMKATIMRFKMSDVRIVVTTSSLHTLCRELNLDLLTSSIPTKPASYDGIWRYARSKLGNILFTRELSRRLLLAAADDSEDATSQHILVNCFFPGNIATKQMDIWKEYLGTALGWSFKKFFSIAGQTTKDGAATALFLAASEKLEEGCGIRGEYFIPIAKQSSPSALARDSDLARALWEWTNTKATEILGEGWHTEQHT